MGSKYTQEELQEIQVLAEQGYSNQQIADKLGRTPAAIRNTRHRNKIKTQTRQTIQTLKTQQQNLTQTTRQLQTKLASLQSRHRQVKQALRLDEETLNRKLEYALRQLKYQKPELFHITVEEQIGKLTAQLAGHLIKWLIS